MKNPKILITGSSGTIGTRLFEKLLEQRYEVVGFDRKPNQWSSTLDELTVRGNLLREKDLEKLPTNVDMIIHLAANARVYKLVLDPSLALENMITTHRILEFTRRHAIQRFLFSSSREVYGNERKHALSEDEVNIQLSESPYTASKIANETLIHAYHKCFGMQYIILRFSNVYGRYDGSDRFFPLLIEKMRRNEEVYIYGKNKVLDFTYIDDCVSGLTESITRFSQVQNETLNIASGKGHTLQEVANLLKTFLGSKSKISIRPNRTGEIVHYIADISKAKNLLGYRPAYSIQRGVKLCVDWYLNYYKNISQ